MTAAAQLRQLKAASPCLPALVELSGPEFTSGSFTSTILSTDQIRVALHLSGVKLTVAMTTGQVADATAAGIRRIGVTALAETAQRSRMMRAAAARTGSDPFELPDYRAMWGTVGRWMLVDSLCDTLCAATLSGGRTAVSA